jgi:hypothetical protein
MMMQRSEHVERVTEADRETRRATLRPSTQVAQRVGGVRLDRAVGTVIVIDPLPSDPNGFFYECVARMPVMTMEQGVIRYNAPDDRSLAQAAASGMRLPYGAHGRVLVTQAAWHVVLGDVVLVRDSRPAGEGTALESLLDTWFNNDFKGVHAFPNSVCDVRHGDILAISTDARAAINSVSDGSSGVASNAGSLRLFLVVDYAPGYVRKVLRGNRGRVVGFRANFDRFFSNLRKPPAYSDAETTIALALDEQKNDADLKAVRQATLLDAVGGRLRCPGVRNRDLVHMILDQL